MSYSVKSIRKEFAAKGVFYTDIKLANILKDILYSYGTPEEVYDPTCGSGNLLSVFPDEVRKYGQELNPEQAEEARQRLTNATIATGDTLTAPAFTDRKFRYISANYPFSVKWEPAEDERWAAAPCLPPPSKADYAFIMHILSMLAPDGVAAVLAFPGVLYRGQREGQLRRWIVEQNLIESVTQIEGGYFEDTKVSTALIVFRRGRTSNTIRFSDHLSGKECEATLEDIRSNDFSLTPCTYLPCDDLRPPEIDPVAKEIEARAMILRQLRAQLNFSAQAITLHEIIGLPPLPPMAEFKNQILELISQY